MSFPAFRLSLEASLSRSSNAWAADIRMPTNEHAKGGEKERDNGKGKRKGKGKGKGKGN
jgi:hypothetical protein